MNNSKTSAPTPTPSTRLLASDSKQRLVYLTVSNELRDIRAKQQIMRNLDQIQRNAEYDESCIRIEISKDGDQWCALIGENLQEGVAGFGAKPMAALRQLVIVQGVDCAEELARQATRLMHGGKLVENVAQGRAAEIAHDYSTVEGSIAAAMADAPGMPEATQGFSADYDAPMYGSKPVKPIGHFARVLRAIAERFVRQHVPTDSDDAYERLVGQLITMMTEMTEMTETLVPLQSPEVYGQPTPAFVRLREENARLVKELKTEKEFSQKLAVEVNQKNETIAELTAVYKRTQDRRDHYRTELEAAKQANIRLTEIIDQLTKERDAYQKDRDHALAQLDGANSRVVAERAVAEEQSNGRETATKELIDVRARLSQAMSRIEQLMKERDDVVAQRQTAWDELRRLHEINDQRLDAIAHPIGEVTNEVRAGDVVHTSLGSGVAIKDPGSKTWVSFPPVPSDEFFRTAAGEYLKLRGDPVTNSPAQVAHEAGRIRDQFLRDRAVTATSIARTS